MPMSDLSSIKNRGARNFNSWDWHPKTGLMGFNSDLMSLSGSAGRTIGRFGGVLSGSLVADPTSRTWTAVGTMTIVKTKPFSLDQDAGFFRNRILSSLSCFKGDGKPFNI